MPDENDAILDAIADWGFEPEPEGEQAQPENQNAETQDTQDGAEGESAEGSNETPTPQEKTYTEAEMRQWAAAQLQNAQSQIQSQKTQQEIQRLLSSDDPEDAQKLQTFIKTNLEQTQQRQQVQSEISDAYAQQILTKIVTDDFLNSLSDEQKSRIDPNKFNNDADFYDALIDVKAEVMANARISAKEQEAAAAAEQARANNQKGAELRQPSLAAVGGSSVPDSGPEDNDSLWAAFLEEVLGPDDE